MATRFLIAKSFTEPNDFVSRIKILIANFYIDMDTSEYNHQKWLEKFQKTKAGKIFDLKYELQSNMALFKSTTCDSKRTYLAAALSIITTGTKYEQDVKELIKLACPDFYEDSVELEGHESQSQ